MTSDNYVFVCPEENAKEEGVELPVEENGTLLLSVLQSQFEGATGIKYRNEITGGWRAIRLSNGVLYPPDKGWSNFVFVVVLASAKGDGSAQISEGVDVGATQAEEDYAVAVSGCSSDSIKRKLEDQEGPRASKNPRSHSPDNYPLRESPGGVPPDSSDMNQEDLIVLGLEYSATELDLKAYFEQFGRVTQCEVKIDTNTKKSRGFGFVRFGDRQVQDRVFEMRNHTIKGRHVDLRFPKQSSSYLPSKLFIGCLPPKPAEVDVNELTEYFGKFGRLTDVYIPRPYRAFGFVTYIDPVVAQKVVNMQHSIRKQILNVSYADPKGAAARNTYSSPTPYNPSMGYGAPPPVPRPQAPSPRYYSAPQAPPPPPQGYGVSGYDGYPRQSHVQTTPNPMRNSSGGPRGASPGQMVYGDPSQSDQTSHQATYGQSNWQIR